MQPLAEAKKLRETNYLLPTPFQDGRAAVQFVKAYEGCWEWESTQPDILIVEGLSDDESGECHTYAKLQPILHKEINKVVVIAREVQTNEIMKLDARIQRISTLEIFTTTRTINVGDTHIIRVQGFDDEGNAFSTLENLRFDWIIGNSDQDAYITLLPMKEADVVSSQSRLEMEQKKMQTDMILIEGLKTGTAKLTVRIVEPGYENVEPFIVFIHVQEPFEILPAYTIYMAPGTLLDYKLYTYYKNEAKKEISIPSENYSWTFDQTEYAKIDNSGRLTALKQGQGMITVSDNRIANNTISSLVHVVQPDRVEIIIKEDNSKELDDYKSDIYTLLEEDEASESGNALVKDRYYELYVRVYDSNHKEILITEQMSFSLTLDDATWTVLESNDNNSHHIVQPKTSQRGVKINLVLEEIKTDVAEAKINPIAATKMVNIYDQVAIVDLPPIVLPYLGSATVAQLGANAPSWALQAKGGSGSYLWDTSSIQIASVNMRGRVSPKGIGSATITVQDLNNALNKDTIVVDVVKIDQLRWVDTRKEVSIGSQSYLELQAFDDKGRKFNNCHYLPIKISNNDEYVVKVLPTTSKNGKTTQTLSEQDPEYSYCIKTPFLAMNQGFAGIIASLSLTDEVYDKPIKSAEAKVSSYYPLRTVSPIIEGQPKVSGTGDEQEMVLSFGASGIWSVEGGPSPWVDFPNLHIKDVTKVSMLKEEDQNDYTTPKDGYLDIQKIGGDAGVSTKHSYLVKCFMPDWANSWYYDEQHLSYDFRVNLNVSNQATAELKHPANETISIIVGCQHPNAVSLHWVADKVFREPKATVEDGEEVHHARNNLRLRSNAILYDRYKRKFFNYSSVELSWILTNNTVGNIQAAAGDNIEETSCYKNEYKCRDIELLQHTGYVYETATVTGYKNTHFDFDTAYTNNPSGPSAKKKIKLMDNVDLVPNYKSIFFHPNNTATLQIVNGSGKYLYDANNTAIADVRRQDKLIYVTPTDTGVVKVVVEDSIIEGSDPGESIVVISDIREIVLSRGGLMELGTTRDFKVDIFDEFNGKFDPQEFAKMDLYLQAESTDDSSKHDDGLEIQQSESDPSIFHVTGVKEGIYRLTAIASNQKKRKYPLVSSNTVRVDVFEPLQFRPSTLLLAPGCAYTVQLQGGPALASNPNIQKSFSIDDDTIASIDKYGEIIAKLVGETSLSVELYQSTGTESRELLTTGKLAVKVALITDVQIPVMQDRQVLTETITRPLAVLKHHNETFTDAICPLSYQWSLKTFHIYNYYADQFQYEMEKTAPSSGSSSTTTTTSTGDQVALPTVTKSGMSVHDQVGVFGHALTQGEGEIYLRVVATYPAPYNDQEYTYSTHAAVKVTDPLRTGYDSIDQKYHDDNMILIPYNSQYKIVTNKDNQIRLSYTGPTSDCGTQSQVVELGTNGSLNTRDKFGKANIIVEEVLRETQISMVNVLVTGIRSLYVVDSYKVLHMPLGSSSVLKVRYQDSLGRNFVSDFEGTSLVALTSNPRVAKVNLNYYGSELTINAVSTGEAMISIYIEDRPLLKDAFRVTVTSIMKPQSPVLVHYGGQIKFSTTADLHTDPTNTKKWSSEDPNIVDVDGSTGVAIGRGEGVTNIHLKDTIRLSSTVTVSKIKTIQLDSFSSPRTITNYVKNESYQAAYRLSFRLFIDDMSEEITPHSTDDLSIIDHRIRFECKSLDPEWALATSEQSESGVNSAVCIVRPRNPTGQVSTHPPSELSIQVTAGSNSSQYQYSIDKEFRFGFLSSFQILDDRRELVFHKNNRTQTINLVGSGDVGIKSENGDFLDAKVTPWKDHTKLDLTIPQHYQTTFQRQRVSIISQSTGQVETIYVTYYDDPSQVSSGGFSLPLIDIFTILVLIAVIFILYQWIVKNKKQPAVPAQGMYYYSGAGSQRFAQQYAQHTAQGTGGKMYGGSPAYNTPMGTNRGESSVYQRTPASANYGERMAPGSSVSKKMAYNWM